jgi:hypothetical protein
VYHNRTPPPIRAIKAAVIPKGTGDIVGIPGKTDAPQVMEVVKFPLHTKKGGLVRGARNTAEELSYQSSPAPSILVEVDVIGCRDVMDPEVWRAAIDEQLRENIIVEIFV